MSKLRGTLIALVVALAAGCGDGRDPYGPEEIEGLPRDLTAAESAIIEADNAFGLKLFRELQAESAAGENIFISPLSVAMALGMTYNGADGTTRDAMRATLELEGLSLEEVNRSYRDLIDLLSGLDRSVNFTLANSIWYREGFAVEQEFLDVNRTYFDAEVAALDFASPDAAATMNAWVSERTNGRIDEIVEAPIPPEVVMYLINAIYFKGSWTVRFAKDLTAPAPFTREDGSTVQVPMMRYPEPVGVGYYGDEEVEVVDLPYGGRAFSMTVVVPREGGLATRVQGLDAARWNGWTSDMRSLEAYVELPRFGLEYEVSLKEALTALGMGVAFSKVEADFSRIYPGPERLYISEVKHKSFVEVNEEGTEAAAATSVEVGIVSVPPTITVDRPFLFAIRERFSGAVLFMGLVYDPS